jgi:hypothetical protein
LHWEQAGITGNRSKGSGGGGNGQGDGATVSGGSGTQRGRAGTREARERERGGVRVPLPHCIAPAVADGGEGTAERRHDVRPRLVNGVRRRSSEC